MSLTQADKSQVSDTLETLENELRAVSAVDRQPVVNAHQAVQQLRTDLDLNSDDE